MKLIFVHDHIFKKSGACVHSSGGLPSSIWRRYTSVFGGLTVVGRDGGLLTSKDKGFTISSADNVQFALLPNMANLTSFVFGNKEVGRSVTRLVEEHEAVIARLPSRLGMLLVKEAIIQNKPYTVEVVGCPRDALWNYGGVQGKLFAPYAYLEMKAALRKSNFAMYVTKDFLQERYPAARGAVKTFCSNVEVPSVNEEILSNRLAKINASCSSQIIVFGLIGNYSSKYKGIDVAIRALASANLPNWQLHILGGGEPSFYIALAKNLGIADRVRFIGRLPAGAPVFQWLDSIDIYLHPSLTEGMPRALIEAMSRACPALASDIGGIPELLDSNEMIGAGDIDELANKIASLVWDKQRQRTLAIQNFTVAKGYYKSVLDERRTEFLHEFKKYIEEEQ